MKTRALITGIAALLLAMGAAHADMQDNWRSGDSKESIALKL